MCASCGKQTVAFNNGNSLPFLWTGRLLSFFCERDMNCDVVTLPIVNRRRSDDYDSISPTVSPDVSPRVDQMEKMSEQTPRSGFTLPKRVGLSHITSDSFQIVFRILHIAFMLTDIMRSSLEAEEDFIAYDIDADFL